MATVAAILTLVLLLHSSGPLWVRRLELLGFVLACGHVLRCSVPLKPLVAEAMQKRRQVDPGW